MPITLSADEVLQIACQIERNGQSFYRRAAEVAGDAASRKMLAELAQWEAQHEKVFAGMRASLTDAERAPEVYDPEDLAMSYLRAFADGHVFDRKADPARLLSAEVTTAQALRIAIGLENDSILFYTALKPVVPVRLGLEKIEEVIREEMRHVAMLSAQLRRESGAAVPI
jgi:rubrerythrin